MILVIAIVIAATTTTSLGVKTGCQIKTIGVSGLIICTFEKDISDAASKYGFIVQRYNLSPDDKRAEEPVVDCSWLDKGLDCTNKPGYSFDNDLSDQAIIAIPNLTEEFEGKYVCQVIGNDDTDDKFCTYRFNDSLSRNSATTSPRPTTVSRNTAVDGNEEFGSSIPGWAIGMIVLVILFMLLLVSVVAISVITIRYRKRVALRPTPDSCEQELDSLTKNPQPTLESIAQRLTNMEEEMFSLRGEMVLHSRDCMNCIQSPKGAYDDEDSAVESMASGQLTRNASRSSVPNRVCTRCHQITPLLMQRATSAMPLSPGLGSMR